MHTLNRRTRDTQFTTWCRSSDLLMAQALIHLKRLQAHREGWLEACALDAKHGYAPAVCLHGKSQRTDYDNICGPCEEGLTDREEALIRGRSDVFDFEARCEAMRLLEQCAGANRQSIPTDLRDALGGWLIESLGGRRDTTKRIVRRLP